MEGHSVGNQIWRLLHPARHRQAHQQARLHLQDARRLAQFQGLRLHLAFRRDLHVRTQHRHGGEQGTHCREAQGRHKIQDWTVEPGTHRRAIPPAGVRQGKEDAEGLRAHRMERHETQGLHRREVRQPESEYRRHCLRRHLQDLRQEQPEGGWHRVHRRADCRLTVLVGQPRQYLRLAVHPEKCSGPCHWLCQGRGHQSGEELQPRQILHPVQEGRDHLGKLAEGRPGRPLLPL